MNIEIVVLDGKYLQSAFELATEVFAAGSTLHKALDIGLAEYRDYLYPSFKEMVAEGLSVVAVDNETGCIVGCMIASDFFEQLNGNVAISNKFAPLSALTNEFCQQYQEYRAVKPGETILIDIGAVLPSASGKGVYQRMRKSVHERAVQQGFNRVVGELSSASTQHVVLHKLGHKQIAEVFFQEFKFEGQYPFCSITEPPSIILAEGDL